MVHSIVLHGPEGTTDGEVSSGNVLGRLAFASNDPDGSYGKAVTAKIEAKAEEAFDADDNQTKLVFLLAGQADSGVATEKMSLSSVGTLTLTGAIELGHASDTTLARASSGDLNVEGNLIYRAGGTDVPVADGGTGASTLTDGGILLGSGTGAITAMSVLGTGVIVVGDNDVDPTTITAFTASDGVLKHEVGGLELDISGIAIGDVLAGTGTGAVGIVTSTGHADGQVLTLQADGTADWEAASGGGAVTALNNAVANRLVTVGATTTQLDAESQLTHDPSLRFLYHSTTDNTPPRFELKHAYNDTTGSEIRFTLDKDAVGADNDIIGIISFWGDDDNQGNSSFATIEGIVADAAATAEDGLLKLSVASYNGTLTQGLALQGAGASGEVDVTIGAGAASVTTIAGTLTMGTTAALTNAGLVAVANQSGITGLGTIGTGVWNGTPIATTYIADDAITGAKIALFDDSLAAITTHFLIADGTDYSSFALSGDVTCTNGGVVTIGADKVLHSMLNDNCISGFGEMATIHASGELLYSFGGVLKRVGIDTFVTKLLGLASAGAVLQTADHMVFLDGGATGDVIVESIDDFLTAIAGSGISVSSSQLITTAAQTNITSLGTLTTLTVDNVIINGTTIGHTSDTDLMTLASGGLTLAGTLTVGADTDGYDVKLFGDTTGMYMQWDESSDRLNVFGSYRNEMGNATNTPAVAYNGTVALADSGATIDIDWSKSNYHWVRLGQNVDVTKIVFTNMFRGGRYILRIEQNDTAASEVSWGDVDGGNASTAAFTEVRWVGGTAPTMSTGTTSTDVYGFLCTRSNGRGVDGFVIAQDLRVDGVH